MISSISTFAVNWRRLVVAPTTWPPVSTKAPININSVSCAFDVQYKCIDHVTKIVLLYIAHLWRPLTAGLENNGEPALANGVLSFNYKGDNCKGNTSYTLKVVLTCDYNTDAGQDPHEIMPYVCISCDVQSIRVHLNSDHLFAFQCLWFTERRWLYIRILLAYPACMSNTDQWFGVQWMHCCWSPK